MLLLARTTPMAEVKKKTEGLSVFIVDICTSLDKGLVIRPIDAMINHGATEVFFNGLEVPAENLIGEEGSGFRYILDGLNAERILVGTEALGDGRWCLKRAVDYANERTIFGRTIGKNQGVQFPLARCHVDLEAADMMCRRAAALFDAGAQCGEAANIAKLLASEAAFKAADVAMQTLGGFSFAKEYDVERKWRETRLFQIAPISTNMILAYIGQHVLGLERSF
jgi:acyl-CoA dehydrogenase